MAASLERGTGAVQTPTTGGYVPPTERADRRWHRALWLGLVIALVVHAALLISVRRAELPPAVFSAAGPEAGDSRAAAGGGGGMEMIQIRVQERAAVVEEAVPEPVIVPDQEIVVEPEPRPEPAPVAAPEVAVTAPGQGTTGEGAGRGEAVGPGLADGRGQGGGGTEGEGSSGVVAPFPRGLFLPPQGAPSDVRGREITIYVFVSAQGRVIPDSTRITPPTRDARYNRRLREQAAEWVFEPARRGGRAVAAWFEYGLTL